MLIYFSLEAAVAQPDLVIQDIWTVNGQLYCQLANQGDLPAPPGHQTVISVDGTDVGWENMQQILDPQESTTLVFQTGWQCTQSQDQVVAMADADDWVTESDETNNQLAETWNCDTVAPTITTGPSLSNLTQDEVTVKWGTNENATGSVAYDYRAKTFEFGAFHQGLSKAHAVTLTGLTPYTTYRCTVRSMDSTGNAVQSDVLTFTTLAQDDQALPQISDFAMSGPPIAPLCFQAEASDDTGVDHMNFYMDGKMFEQDYRRPFQAVLDPIREALTHDAYYNSHTFKTAAIDRVQKTTDKKVAVLLHDPCRLDEFNFVSPMHGRTLYVDEGAVHSGSDPIQVIVYAHSFFLKQTRDRLGRIIGTNQNVETIELRIDGEVVLTVEDSTELIYDWDPSGTPIGDVDFKVVVSDGDCYPYASTHTLSVVGRTASLNITSRTVTRHDSHFTVTLEMENPGNQGLELTRIRDSLYGFQIIPHNGTFLDVTGSYDPETQICSVRIDTSQFIGAGDTFSVSYDVVPVMLPFHLPHAVGPDPVQLRYRFQDRNHRVDCAQIYEGPNLDDDVEAAFAASNYLIVTSPKAMLARYNDREVQQLLRTIAELAIARQAVLGYFHNNRTLRTRLDASDGVAMGNVLSEEWDHEIFVAEEEYGMVSGHRVGHDFELKVEGLSASDALAVGNVDNVAGPLHHPEDEILIMDGHDQIGRLRYFKHSTDGFTELSKDTSWQPGDLLMTGNIWEDVTYPEDELLILHDSGVVEFYYDHLSTYAWFNTLYDPEDLVLIANIFGNNREELMIANKSANELVFYEDTVELIRLSMPPDRDLNDFTAMAAGNLLSLMRGHVVGLDPVADEIVVFECDWLAEQAIEHASYPMSLAPDDVLFVSDVIDTGYEEMLVGRRSRHDGHPMGHFDIFSLPGNGPVSDRHTLDRLISPLGAWADNMAPGWLDTGYLLIVGETDIVPAFSDAWHLGDGWKSIESTDSFYADTAGEIKEPELAVGRIITRKPETMRHHLERILSVMDGDPNFDKSDALVAAGRNEGPDGTSADINFTRERWHIDDALTDKGYYVALLEDPDVNEFFTAAQDKDVIHLAAHGSITSWDVVHIDDVDAQFDPVSTAPLIYANSCNTANYVRGRCLAEAFIEHGASAYIGATEVSYSPTHRDLAEGFYSLFDVGTPVGLALKNAKRDHMDDDSYGQYVSAVMHLFGDPMQEPEVAKKRSAENLSPVIEGPVGSIQIIIPDFEVRTSDVDDVSIPGGSHTTVPGEPLVPTYSASIHYPFGHQVQDVSLTSKTNVSYPTGLNLDIAEPVLLGVTNRHSRGSTGPEPHWWPTQDFDWEIRLNADGSTALFIEVYPFVHNAITHESQFYQEFNFNVTETTTSLAIHYFSAQKVRHAWGEPIVADLHFENFGIPMDCLVEMSLESHDGNASRGFPLARLRDVQSYVTYSATLDPTGLNPGPYALSCRLTDTLGQGLGEWTTQVFIGLPRGITRNLTITPKCFNPGDTVEIRCDFENTGDLPLSGQLLLELLDLEHDETFAISQDFSELAPGAQVSVQENWGASAPYSRIHLSAAATFDGVSSPIEVYRFPTDVTLIQGDLPQWPAQQTIQSLIRTLFCNL